MQAPAQRVSQEAKKTPGAPQQLSGLQDAQKLLIGRALRSWRILLKPGRGFLQLSGDLEQGRDSKRAQALMGP